MVQYWRTSREREESKSGSTEAGVSIRDSFLTMTERCFVVRAIDQQQQRPTAIEVRGDTGKKKAKRSKNFIDFPGTIPNKGTTIPHPCFLLLQVPLPA